MSHGPARDRGGPPYVRRGPYGRDQDDGADDSYIRHEKLQGAKIFIKITVESNVKAVATKIAHMCRTADPPALLCAGSPSISQAVKAIAVAREYLRDYHIDIAFQPAFRDKDRLRPTVAMYLARQVAPTVHEDHAELTVSAHSKPTGVAGALAARVRDELQVCVTAIGVEAVSNAVLTIGNGRLYLEQDSQDVRAMPEFYTIAKNGIELHAVRFVICAERI